MPTSLPSVATRQAIVAEIKGEQALVATNRKLITRFEKKTQATLARIGGGSHDHKATGVTFEHLQHTNDRRCTLPVY